MENCNIFFWLVVSSIKSKPNTDARLTPVRQEIHHHHGSYIQIAIKCALLSNGKFKYNIRSTKTKSSVDRSNVWRPDESGAFKFLVFYTTIVCYNRFPIYDTVCRNRKRAWESVKFNRFRHLTYTVSRPCAVSVVYPPTQPNDSFVTV